MKPKLDNTYKAMKEQISTYSKVKQENYDLQDEIIDLKFPNTNLSNKVSILENTITVLKRTKERVANFFYNLVADKIIPKEKEKEIHQILGNDYKPQKRIEIIESHTKPKKSLIGHYHKSYHFLYRNVQCIQVPGLCGKTQFQQKQGLINSVGGYFLKVWSDKKGNIQYMEPEEVLFEVKDLWDEAGKDKNKVKKLVIKNGIYWLKILTKVIFLLLFSTNY